MRALMVATAAALAFEAVPARPHFTDVTVPAGVSYVQHQPYGPPDCIFMQGNWCEPDRMSGGAAVGDVDGDGFADLFVTRLDLPNILFRNLGNGTFQDVTAAAGLVIPNVHSNGAAFADVDNDGDLDLYVTALGESGDPINDRNYLFINDGLGHFTEEAVARGAAIAGAGSHRTFSAAFGDYDLDGWVDLFTTEWVPGGSPNARLLRNRGSAAPGRFTDVTTAAGISMSGVHGFAAAFSDLDADGWPDLAVAADYGTSRLYWNRRDGTFMNGTAAAGVGTDENGMGSTIGDFDGDGDLDWFVTSIYDAANSCAGGACNWGASGNRLYRNNGNRTFQDATDGAGVRDGAWGWGAAFFDYDNDADLDLVMTNGVDFPLISVDAPFNADVVRFWENGGTGVMTEMAAGVGVADTGSGKGLVVFDYDRDGDQDLFLVNNAAAPKLYRNDGGNAASWLRVRTVGAVGNLEGLGALVSVRAIPGGPVQVREIGSPTHFLGHSEREAHFGLGAGSAPIAELIVKWPAGKTQGFTQIARNTTLVARQADCVDGDGDGYCRIPDCDDTSGAIRPGATELCDGRDNDCDGVIDEVAGCVRPAGHVQELHLSKISASLLALTWSASCSPEDQDYEVYEAALGSAQPLLSRACTTGGAAALTLTPSAGNQVYLVVPRNFGREGSYGKKSDGSQRAKSPASCLPQMVGACQ